MDILRLLGDVEEPFLGGAWTSWPLPYELQDGCLTLEVIDPGRPVYGSIRGTLSERSGLQVQLRPLSATTAEALTEALGGRGLIPGTKMIALAGEASVGRSTLAWQLACALQRRGRRVAFLDADLERPPMFAIAGPPPLIADAGIVPWRRDGLLATGVRAFWPLAEAPAWRGAELTRVLRRFIDDVLWQNPDVVLVRLPCGYGEQTRTALQTPDVVELVQIEGALGQNSQAGASLAQEAMCNFLGSVRVAASFEGRRLWPETAAELAALPFCPQLAAGGSPGADYLAGIERLARVLS